MLSAREGMKKENGIVPLFVQLTVLLVGEGEASEGPAVGTCEGAVREIKVVEARIRLSKAVGHGWCQR